MKHNGIHPVGDIEAATVRVEPPACDWVKEVAASIPDKPLAPPFLSKKSRSEVERLAGLPVDVYEAERKAAAGKLGMRTSVLDGVVKTIRQPLTGGSMRIRAVEPAADKVDGAQLLEGSGGDDRALHEAASRRRGGGGAVGLAQPLYRGGVPVAHSAHHLPGLRLR